MTYFMRALKSEILKLKRTPSLLIVLVAPLLVNVLYMIILGAQGWSEPLETPWLSLVGSAGTIWAIFMLPLVIVSVTALWANFEHEERQWKHLFVLPIPRPAIYAAKWVCSLALIAVSTLLLGAFNLLGGVVLGLIMPWAGFQSPAPAGFIMGHLALLFLAAILIVTIHTWVSLRWRNLFVALGFGLATLLAGIFISLDSGLNRFFPWSFPLRVHAMPEANQLETIGISIAGALIVAVQWPRYDLNAS